MINYARGYYNDEAKGPYSQGSAARHYAAIMGRSPPSRKDSADVWVSEDSDEEIDNTDAPIESQLSMTRKTVKPRFYNYNMESRKSHGEQSKFNKAVNYGYAAFKQRYGEDSLHANVQKILKRPQVRSLPEPERNEVKSYERKEPRVRLLSVTPDPDLPSGPAMVLEAQDLSVLLKKKKMPLFKRISTMLFQHECLPTGKGFAWVE